MPKHSKNFTPKMNKPIPAPGLRIGRTLKFAVADGYASYSVEEIRRPKHPGESGEVVVQLIPDGSGYEFEGVYERNGVELLPLPVAEKNVKWEDDMNALYRRCS